MDSAFILNRRPFRDNSLLVDLLTQESGRITCVARVAKKRGKIMAGTLEPFRLLGINWIGRGDVQTLTLAEEQGRYRISVSELCKALYLNELILKLLPKHAPAHTLFKAYQWAIQQLTLDSQSTLQLMQCELAILEALGYSFRYSTEHQTGAVLQSHYDYRYHPDSGLSVDSNMMSANQSQSAGVAISGKLLIKLNERSTLNENEQYELRHFLNRFIDILLAGKKLNSRKLAFGY